MSKRAILSTISLYGVAHALVDAACIGTLFASAARSQAQPQDPFGVILFYNVISLSTQPLWGLGVDAFKAPRSLAVLGMLLVAASPVCLPLPWLVALVAGLGNALFHVGGGALTLKLASGKAALPGVFVGPGALGLTIGTWLSQGGHFVAWPFSLLLAASALLILKTTIRECAASRRLPGNPKWFESVILLLLIPIAIRSLVGLSLIFPWKSDPGLLFALTAAVVLGKALGGVLGDRFGWTMVAVGGLAVSAPLLTVFAQTPALAILGTFLFNLSMPITLTCLAELLPGKGGFAFGLTALALLLGAWPTFTPLHALASQPMIILITILISIVTLYGGVRLYLSCFRDRCLTQPYQRQLNKEVE